ncbi:uncharacterized protein LOC108221128 [Daucus carota subsp. sativus]|uniref:uncharacterized protein LOC108221128 n=1 Tax=Daucus carota subsp. sativus TaxID=79200 RepID=UPI003083999F
MGRRGKRINPKGWNGYNGRKTAPNYIWRPCIPSWEREFTRKVGNIKWDDFVEKKKAISIYSNILEWKDSACEEAFQAAKRRFQDEYNGYESEFLLPDQGIDLEENIDLKPHENNVDEEPLLSISQVADNDSENEVMPSRPIALEEIIPTGWDVDVYQTPTSLTGWIVGNDNN